MVAPAELPILVIAELAGQDPDVQQVYIGIRGGILTVYHPCIAMYIYVYTVLELLIKLGLFCKTCCEY